MRVILSARAVADLERVGDSIARDNPRRALTFVQELRVTCLRLAQHPARYPLVAAHASTGIRRAVYGNYLIFYRVGQDAVEVIAILHGAMDYEGILFPNG
ncbi:MAG TPA: type II toxin-antitoxin system RelE/ParE family toxin [Salinarimonas sp.]|nr:type II toxin-antitoxin system RelE/ParE family toxin [Salinarimonas sp.]